MRKIVALVGLAAILALGAYTYYAFTQARYMQESPVMITVSGDGEVFAKPDVATFSFSVNTKADDASTAISDSAAAIKSMLEFLKEQAIEERDIKTTNYYSSPRYEYPDTRCTQWGCPPVGEQKIIGYEVTQTITVKVRNPAKAGELIAGVGSRGATNISGLNFTIDDTDALKAEARTAAINEAQGKAEKLAKELDVRIVRMAGFWEDEGVMPYYGMGGKEMMMADAATVRAPQLPVGENTITSRVNITYEVR